MKKFKRILASAVAGAIMVGLAGCGGNSTTDNGGSAAADNKSGELQKIVIGCVSTDNALVYNAAIAANAGYLEKELEDAGYEIEYQGFAQGGPAINEAIASGAVDITVYGDFPAITAVSNDVDLKVIASATTNATYAIAAGNDTGISSVTDLKGKNVCAGFGTVVYKYLADVLKDNGLSIDDVNVINTGTDGPTMIASGDADAFVSTYEGILTMLPRTDGVSIINDNTEKPELGTTFVVAARGAFLEEHEDAAVAFVKALEEAYEYAVENPEGALDNLVTDTLTSEMIREVYSDTSFSYFNPQFTEDFRAKLQSSIDFMLENQLITNEVTYEDIVDTSIQEKVFG